MKTADFQSSTNIEKMLARANMFRVNVIIHFDAYYNWFFLHKNFK